MAYDSARKRAILTGLGEENTWTWDGRIWTEIPGSGSPAGFGAALAYDRKNRVVVAFGGQLGLYALVDDTWTWDGSAWRKSNPAVRPGARTGSAAAFDEQSGRIVIFGGDRELGAILP